MSDTTPLPLDAYYDSGHKSYLVRDDDGSWMPVDKADIKMRLQKLGLKSKREEGCVLSAVDLMTLRIQNERHVTYTGPLAGYKCGLHVINGSKILVTQSPRIITPAKGDWSVLQKLIDNQLAPLTSGEVDQRILLKEWWRRCVEDFLKCYYDDVCVYGQVLGFVGPRSCGKSLLQQLITETIGGRCAAPYLHMSGKTHFNRDLFGAEHQMVEDEQPHVDYKSRVAFGEAIKQMAANGYRPCHGKGRDIKSLTPFWRMTLSINDEPDHMAVLPPLESSLLNKMDLLHCRCAPMPMPACTADEKAAFWKQLTSELPAFLWHLQNEFVCPDSYRDPEGRYALMPFIHPYILTLLDDIAPETQLLSMIDHCLFAAGENEWRGTAEELIHRLTDNIHFGPQARRIVTNSTWTGKLLGKLAKATTPRVTEERQSNLRTWVISRPAVAPNSQSTILPFDNGNAAS